MAPHITIFGTRILSYSICNAVAYLAAAFLFYLEAKRKQYPLEPVLHVLFGSLLGALIGSRLGSAFFVYPDFFTRNPLAILLPQLGGKTLVGGLIGGYLGVVITRRIIGFRRSTGDLFAPGVALGIAIGRIGCFLNGCCFGLESHLPWAVSFNGIPSHPAQLYESIFSLGLFLMIWKLRTGIAVEGDLFKIFLFSYAAFRFMIEFLRADQVGGWGGLSIAQWISLAVLCQVGEYFLQEIEKRREENAYGK
ncbi:MAG TPA: prolipoprotein diacylglyceryl transferase [Candidatus Omnitrophota bacterium]|nr:prolipoprotein diacylglyceryl transferase [Candidatus Omnitrophota bacterium]HRZ14400.1 prolipoprotein diacylglyceryl transferase [Candidatus Omnitrophota bacterium]